MGQMMTNCDFLLYFGRSLYRHFWTKSIKIHELLKVFRKIFQMRPTRFLGIKVFKSYKQTKLKCSASQNYNNPQNFILAIFCPKTQILPIFFAESHSMGCVFAKKINNFDFRHFLRPPPSGGDFWPIWPPYPHPMGHPTQLPTWLPTFMFFVSNEPKNDA